MALTLRHQTQLTQRFRSCTCQKLQPLEGRLLLQGKCGRRKHVTGGLPTKRTGQPASRLDMKAELGRLCVTQGLCETSHRGNLHVGTEQQQYLIESSCCAEGAACLSFKSSAAFQNMLKAPRLDVTRLDAEHPRLLCAIKEIAKQKRICHGRTAGSLAT